MPTAKASSPIGSPGYGEGAFRAVARAVIGDVPDSWVVLGMEGNSYVVVASNSAPNGFVLTMEVTPVPDRNPNYHGQFVDSGYRTGAVTVGYPESWNDDERQSRDGFYAIATATHDAPPHDVLYFYAYMQRPQIFPNLSEFGPQYPPDSMARSEYGGDVLGSIVELLPVVDMFDGQDYYAPWGQLELVPSGPVGGPIQISFRTKKIGAVIIRYEVDWGDGTVETWEPEVISSDPSPDGYYAGVHLGNPYPGLARVRLAEQPTHTYLDIPPDLIRMRVIDEWGRKSAWLNIPINENPQRPATAQDHHGNTLRASTTSNEAAASAGVAVHRPWIESDPLIVPDLARPILLRQGTKFYLIAREKAGGWKLFRSDDAGKSFEDTHMDLPFDSTYDVCGAVNFDIGGRAVIAVQRGGTRIWWSEQADDDQEWTEPRLLPFIIEIGGSAALIQLHNQGSMVLQIVTNPIGASNSYNYGKTWGL